MVRVMLKWIDTRLGFAGIMYDGKFYYIEMDHIVIENDKLYVAKAELE